MKRCALGQTKEVDYIKNHAEDIKHKSRKELRDEINEFKLQLDSVAKMFRMLRRQVSKKKSSAAEENGDNPALNQDGIPLNSSYIGITSKSQYPYILIVDQDGIYRIGQTRFSSLSAAAEHVSGVRRSGWTFWRFFDGRTLKEVYKDR